MMKNWLRAFFVVLIVVGGVWWYQDGQQDRGNLVEKAAQVEVQSNEEVDNQVDSSEIKILKEHEPVNAGVDDWELWQMIGFVGLMALGMTGLYKLTYRVYWLG